MNVCKRLNVGCSKGLELPMPKMSFVGFYQYSQLAVAKFYILFLKGGGVFSAFIGHNSQEYTGK